MTKSYPMNVAIALFAILAVALAFVPAFALADDDDGHTYVVNSNHAVVENITDASAHTGNNWAGGSHGGNGGHGGDISNGSYEGGESDGDVEEAVTGDGGMGGDGMDGGFVQTGEASAIADTFNVVNTNHTDVSPCECDEDGGNGGNNGNDGKNGDMDMDNDMMDGEDGEDGDDMKDDDRSSYTVNFGDDEGSTMVRSRNRATVFNATLASADTGHNEADGSSGGNGGHGGDISNMGNGDVDEVVTGMGGNGGTASNTSGGVFSGVAFADSVTVNVVNENVTRVRR